MIDYPIITMASQPFKQAPAFKTKGMKLLQYFVDFLVGSIHMKMISRMHERQYLPGTQLQ